MKVQEANSTGGEQAVENLRISDRSMRRWRERRLLPGTLLHIDASRHAWLPGGQQDRNLCPSPFRDLLRLLDWVGCGWMALQPEADRHLGARAEKVALVCPWVAGPAIVNAQSEDRERRFW